MDIAFKNKKLEKVLNSDKELATTYGTKLAKKIKTRLGVLKGAKHLGLVPAERPERRHKLTGDRDGQWSVDLDENYRLFFEPITEQETNEIKPEDITAIRILEVGDPH